VSRAQYSASAQISPISEQPSPAPAGTSRRRVLTRFVPAVAGLGIAALLVGCGAGQITQTDTQRSAVNGASGQVGMIAIRGAELQYPDNPQGVYAPGSNVTLVVTIANTGIDNDELLSVSSPIATSVTIDGSPTGTKPLPGNFSIVSGVDVDDSDGLGMQVSTTSSGAAPSSSASAPSSSASTTKTSGSTATSGAHGSSTSTTAPTSAPAPALPPGSVKIVLTGLKTINGQPLRSGLTVPITFTFARAGQCTIGAVPVAAAPDSVRLDTGDDTPANKS
jgi:copper(I)-binding protein